MAKKKANKKTRRITMLTKRVSGPRTLHLSRDVNIRITPTPRVVPPRTPLYNGQRAVWINLSSHRMRVQVFDAIMGPPFFLTIEPGTSEPAPAVVSAPVGQIFAYSVVDLVTSRGVPGNSPPDIIIE